MNFCGKVTPYIYQPFDLADNHFLLPKDLKLLKNRQHPFHLPTPTGFHWCLSDLV